MADVIEKKPPTTENASSTSTNAKAEADLTPEVRLIDLRQS